MSAIINTEIMNSINKIATYIVIASFMLSITIFFVTTNVRIAFNSTYWYEYGFERHDVSYRTSLSQSQLSQVAKVTANYFNTKDEYLKINVNITGEVRELFNENEQIHMKDVKDLVNKVYTTQMLSGIYILLYILFVFTIAKGRKAVDILNKLIYSGLLTMFIILLIGCAAILSFEYMFEQFHVLSFNNELWKLDPRHNYLTRLFTQGFFFESTLLIGTLSLIQSTGLIIVSLVCKAYYKKAIDS